MKIAKMGYLLDNDGSEEGTLYEIIKTNSTLYAYKAASVAIML